MCECVCECVWWYVCVSGRWRDDAHPEGSPEDVVAGCALDESGRSAWRKQHDIKVSCDRGRC